MWQCGYMILSAGLGEPRNAAPRAFRPARAACPLRVKSMIFAPQHETALLDAPCIWLLIAARMIRDVVAQPCQAYQEGRQERGIVRPARILRRLTGDHRTTRGNKAARRVEWPAAPYNTGISRKNRAAWEGVNMTRALTSGVLTLALCSILVPSAQATTVPVSLASGIAKEVQDAQYYYGQYCKEVWRCGRYACGWQHQCYFPPSGLWRGGCPRGWTIQDGWCKPYRGY